jgi:hypothetical protein
MLLRVILVVDRHGVEQLIVRCSPPEDLQELLDRVQLGAVTRQPLELQVRVVSQSLVDRPTALLRGVVDQQHTRWEVPVSAAMSGCLRLRWAIKTICTRCRSSMGQYPAEDRIDTVNRIVNESALDEQVLVLFAKLRVDDDEVRDWFVSILRAKTHDEQREARKRLAGLTRQLTALRGQQDELLNPRLLKEIEAVTFSRKATELRDREGRLKVEIEACDLGRHEQADFAIKAFELSQSLIQKWVAADIDAKRRILEILWLNCTLVDVSLAPEWRKPFDLLAEGLPLGKSRTGGI